MHEGSTRHGTHLGERPSAIGSGSFREDPPSSDDSWRGWPPRRKLMRRVADFACIVALSATDFAWMAALSVMRALARDALLSMPFSLVAALPLAAFCSDLHSVLDMHIGLTQRSKCPGPGMHIQPQQHSRCHPGQQEH